MFSWSLVACPLQFWSTLPLKGWGHHAMLVCPLYGKLIVCIIIHVYTVCVGLCKTIHVHVCICKVRQNLSLCSSVSMIFCCRSSTQTQGACCRTWPLLVGRWEVCEMMAHHVVNQVAVLFGPTTPECRLKMLIHAACGSCMIMRCPLKQLRTSQFECLEPFWSSSLGLATGS